MTKRKYLMKKITPKNGVLRNVHVGILDRECEIIYISRGSSAIFQYELNGETRAVHTSYVLDIKTTDTTLVIETRNTIYELEKL